jgi:adenylate kinase
VLDGFPRSLPQAIFLDEWLAAKGLKLDAAVSLEAPFDELLARIRNRVECPECRWSGQRRELAADDQCPVCGSPAASRADDSEQNFRSRHAEFVSLTQPVIGHYRQLGVLSPCDATAPQDEVAAQLLSLFPLRPLENPTPQFLS